MVPELTSFDCYNADSSLFRSSASRDPVAIGLSNFYTRQAPAVAGSTAQHHLPDSMQTGTDAHH